MRLRWRWLIVPTLALGLVAGLQLGALAIFASSGAVIYWGPTQVQGNNWCGKVSSTVEDTSTTPGFAQSLNSAMYGNNCLNYHNVPSGYLGAQVHLVRSNGTLCGSTAWSFNNSSISSHGSLKNLNPSGSCPNNGTYRSDAHAQHYNPNTTQFVVSNWVSSPYITFIP